MDRANLCLVQNQEESQTPDAMAFFLAVICAYHELVVVEVFGIEVL